jgi:hypothetical protein
MSQSTDDGDAGAQQSQNQSRSQSPSQTRSQRQSRGLLPNPILDTLAPATDISDFITSLFLPMPISDMADSHNDTGADAGVSMYPGPAMDPAALSTAQDMSTAFDPGLLLYRPTTSRYQADGASVHPRNRPRQRRRSPPQACSTRSSKASEITMRTFIRPACCDIPTRGSRLAPRRTA